MVKGRTTPFRCSRYSSSPKWECGDGFCIERYFVCDGEFDCLNGTDEFNCGELVLYLYIEYNVDRHEELSWGGGGNRGM